MDMNTHNEVFLYMKKMCFREVLIDTLRLEGSLDDLEAPDLYRLHCNLKVERECSDLEVGKGVFVFEFSIEKNNNRNILPCFEVNANTTGNSCVNMIIYHRCFYREQRYFGWKAGENCGEKRVRKAFETVCRFTSS